MLSSKYLDACPSELVELYAQLETDIVCDMAKRLKGMGDPSDSVEWQKHVMSELSAHNSYVQRKLKGIDKKTASTLYRLLKNSVAESARNDLKVYSKADMSDNQKQVLNNTIAKLADGKISKGSAHAELIEGEFKTLYSGCVRLTQSIAKESQTRFIQECNRAYMKVASGAYDYQSAIREGVNSLARDEIRVVEYNYDKSTVVRSIESSVRSNVMTGVNQLAAESTDQNMADLECEFVEVSAHVGARHTDKPRNEWSNHDEWQGKIFHIGGDVTVDGVTYRDFHSVCGLGEADGICGINCRHSYYPYFPGMPRMYERQEINRMNERKVEYKGDLIPVYEAEQKQRYIERQIRGWKRTAAIQESGGNDSFGAKEKVRYWQATARNFIEETGLRRDYSREQIGK